MPTFDFTSPDGKTYSVTGPEGATAEQAFQILQGQLGQAQDTPVTANDLVRATATGVPLVGGLLNKANAATNAALAPIVEPFLTPSENDISRKGENFSERYQKSLAMQNAQDKAFERDHPVINTTANVVGAVGATLPAASTRVGAALLGNVGKSLPTQMAAGAASGAAIGAADSALREQDAASGAGVGAITGAAGPVLGRALGGIAGKVLPKTELLTSQELKAISGEGYDAIRNSGVKVKPEGVGNWVDDVRVLLKDNEGAHSVVQPKTFALLDKIQNGAKEAQATGAYADIGDLHAFRKAFGTLAKDPVEASAALPVKRAIDDYIANIPKSDIISGNPAGVANTLREANQNYSAYKNAQLVEKKIDRALNQAGSANSGANVENSLRQRIKDILNSDKLIKGYSAEEVAAMKAFVRGDRAANVFRTIGNFAGGGGLGSVVASGTGALTMGPLGALAPVPGWALKKFGNYKTAKAAQELSEIMRSSAPANQGRVQQIKLEKARVKSISDRSGSAAARGLLALIGTQ